MPFTVGRYTPDASLYGQVREFIEEPEFRVPGRDPLVVDRQFEVGLTFGTDPRIPIWFLHLTRLHIGYAWSENFRGLRIKIGNR